MKCKRCFKKHGISKPMSPGIAMLPVMGNRSNRHHRGATIYPIGGVMAPVLKCKECGYSLSYHGRVMGFLPIHTETSTYTVADS